MKFQAAMDACPPGFFVKDEREGWNEYAVQFGRGADGVPFWTAGGTVGGDLTPERTPTDEAVYHIYDRMGSKSPLSLNEVKRLYEGRQRRLKVEQEVWVNDRNDFLGKVNRVIHRQLETPIAEGTLLYDALPSQLNTLAVEILKIIDGKQHPKDPGYTLIAKSVGPIGHHSDISGELAVLFNGINT
jgi:hypothetical protein